jgi:hypothetical protein
MSSRTQERLVDMASTLGHAVQQHDIPELRLPDSDWRPAQQGTPSRRRRQLSRSLAPLGAAAAVLGLVVALFYSRTLESPDARISPAPSVSTLAPGPRLPANMLPDGMPRYLAVAVQGHGYIQSSETGRVVARIPPPAKGLVIEGIAVAPGDNTIYLATAVMVRDAPGGVRVEFFRLGLHADGRPGPARRLPGPPVRTNVPVTSDALVQIPLAISPDGKELAYTTEDQFYDPGYVAAHPPAISVITVASGVTRTWRLWRGGRAAAFESISWATGGELSFAATISNAAVSHGTLIQRGGSNLSAFMVLQTTAPGSSLAADSKLVTVGQFISFEGSAHREAIFGGIISPNGRSAYVLRGTSGGKELDKVSVGTGKVIQVLLSGPPAWEAVPASLDGHSVLLPVGPRRPPRPTASYVCAHLANMTLPSAHVRQLPVPLECSTAAPPPVVQAAW